jgi:alkyl sulfatase BDS1-like metallo-beta-lactamase superfamily hydrolase
MVAKHGLYEVVPGLYQIRGFDLSVMSLIEGDTGVIVVDPLVSQETAAAGIELYRRHRGDRPVTAVVYQTGDFRWAATLLDHAVFADQTHQGARLLYANTLEQLGYGAENGIWRNFFLSGATELRDGNFGTPVSGAAPLIVAQLTPEQLFDAIAITVNGPQAWDLDLAFDITLTDLDRSFHLTLRNGFLNYVERPADSGAALHLTVSKPRLLGLVGGDLSPDGLDVSGDLGVLQQLLAVLEPGDPSFDIITP